MSLIKQKVFEMDELVVLQLHQTCLVCIKHKLVMFSIKREMACLICIGLVHWTGHLESIADECDRLYLTGRVQ
jgi:hypothetical protein